MRNIHVRELHSYISPVVDDVSSQYPENKYRAGSKLVKENACYSIQATFALWPYRNNTAGILRPVLSKTAYADLAGPMVPKSAGLYKDVCLAIRIMRTTAETCYSINVCHHGNVGGRLYVLGDFPPFDETPRQSHTPEALKRVFEGMGR